VQGVFFRAEARARAESLGVAGWIRNVPGGGVEAVFEGEDDAVYRHGRSVSTRFLTLWWYTREEPVGETGFRVR
jgi:acylphosphatase